MILPFQYRLLNRSSHPASGSAEPWEDALKSLMISDTLSFPNSVFTAFSDSEILLCYKETMSILDKLVIKNIEI